MAAPGARPCRPLNLFGVFLLVSAVTTDENTTSYGLETTASYEQNVTYGVADSLPTTEEPAELDLTSPTASPTASPSSTEAPVRPTASAEPLPASGRLPSPVSGVASLCPCDHHKDVCDINCCCDRDCGEEVALFTGCSAPAVGGNKQLCSREVASYSLGSTVDGYAELRSSVRTETSGDILCIQSQNRVDGLSHPSPALPTDSNFDSLFQEFASFAPGPEGDDGGRDDGGRDDLSGYQLGDVMATLVDGGHGGTLRLPAPGVTADCVDSSAAAFLRDQSTRCSRRVALDRDCGTLPGLSADTYTDIQLFAGKTTDAAVVPVEVAAVILQSAQGTQTELQVGGGESLRPTLLKPSLCANVVLEVAYVVKYNPAGEIVNATVSLVLGFVSEAAVALEQQFRVTFVQDGEGAAVRWSGNPGYVSGLPLVSGTRTAEGIARSADPGDTVSVLHGADDQDCLRGTHQRSPVLFGVDSASGCALRLEDAANCSFVFRELLDVLRGPNYPQIVASFGNSPLDYPLDWVPIETNVGPLETQTCSIPLSLHLDIEWTNYGSLVNPQARIVSIKEIIQTNTTSLTLLSGGSSVLPIRSSVAFTPVSAPALPGYRATPTIDAKLPFDFFFPFV